MSEEIKSGPKPENNSGPNGIAILALGVGITWAVSFISETFNLKEGMAVAVGVAGIAILVLAFTWWFWAFIFFVVGLASLFSVFACIIHFQILWAVIYFFAMMLAWFAMAVTISKFN